MPSLEDHPDQQRAARQEQAAAFWQRTIDDGRQQRQAAEQLAQTERQEQRQDRTETQRARLSM
jgi:hypothetical protein